MEAQTDIQTYLEQGKEALAQGEGRAAAIAYAHGAQIEPENAMVHLGLAEANLALGNNSVVEMACRRVQELQPTGGIEGMTAQAILDLLDKRYDRALQYADAVIGEDPSIAYVHALRSYVMRVKGQDYDANLARARAARLSYGGRFDGCFPPLESRYSTGYKPASAPPPLPASEPKAAPAPSKGERDSVPTWSRPGPMQRQMVRARFTLSRYPGLITNILIGMNVVVFLITALLSHNFLTNDPNVLVNLGGEVGLLVIQGHEYWRILTAMFLHAGLIHVALNMLSLFFIGRVVEMLYGGWRYLLIYLLGGIVGGVVALFLSPADSVLIGASGAIFGVFGALGTFYFVNRQALGVYGRGAISNWLFWVGLNLIWGFSVAGISIADHIGGLISGMILGWLLMPRLGGRRI